MISALNPQDTPENKGRTFATVNYVAEGHYISIYSMKAQVWVRLLNRYVKLQDAIKAIETYGWERWNMPHVAHAHHRPTAKPNEGRSFFRS